MPATMCWPDLGSKDTNRAVASDAAGRSGLSSGLLKTRLPLVAMLAAGYFSKQSRGGELGGLLDGGGSSALNDILGKLGR